MAEENDNLSAFRKFIDESLDLDRLAAPPSDDGNDLPLSLSPAQIPDDIGFVPSPQQMAHLREDIEKIWASLQQDSGVNNGWQPLLTMFERDTLNIVTRLLLAHLQNKRASTGGRLDAQDMIRSSITAGWLIMAMLISKYMHEADDGDPPDDSKDIPF